jgi:hypothetical protein
MTLREREQRFDPITLEIILSALQAISDEMFAAMRKTATSAIIYEVLDMGTGVTDGSGRLAASGAGIPAFVGSSTRRCGGSWRSTRPRRSPPATSSSPTTPSSAASPTSTTRSSRCPCSQAGE